MQDPGGEAVELECREEAPHRQGGRASPTHEIDEDRLICRSVRELYGTTQAAEFGPLELTAVRPKFLAAGWWRSPLPTRPSP